jgi:hypothetical protein
MKTINVKYRIIERMVNALLIIALILIMSLYSITTRAQQVNSLHFMGLEGMFGVRSFTLKSNIDELNGLRVTEEGGSAGVTMGNAFYKVNARLLGFYYSASHVSRTVDMFEVETTLNVYPLQLLKNYRSAFNVYLSGGLTMDKVKFFGHYLYADKADVNYSDIREPYLGKITHVLGTAGVGVEYRLPRFDFVHLFAEARMGMPIQKINHGNAFEQTAMRDYTAISIGVSFGKLF